MLETIIKDFIMRRSYKPSNVNHLLDFLQSRYVQGELSISEYRDFFNELNQIGAVKPSFTNEYKEDEYKDLA